jgi:hypothetical protein
MSIFNLRKFLEKQAAKGDEVTESQLDAQRKNSDPLEITQKQLDAQREGEADKVTEAQLNKTRKADAKTPVKTAAKDAVKPTESLLQDGRKDTEPTSISEKQLDAQRTDGKALPIEARLDKVRTGSAETLTEERLDSSKSKLVKHRNAEASAGDINKLEEQRLANKPVEKEVAKPASEGRKMGDFSVSKEEKLRLASFLEFPILKKKLT